MTECRSRSAGWVVAIVALAAGTATIWAGQDRTASIAARPGSVEAVTRGLDTLWVTLAAMLVFFMQAGFGMVEAGFIRAKMNSLIDPAIIKALYRASQAGVRVELVVRGMCRLRAGLKRLSANIRVISIVDRYLEHSRIYHFRNGGQEEVYLSSADWMERNLDERLELLFPLLDRRVKRKAIQVLDVALLDNVKAWEMQPDGTYRRVVRRKKARRIRSQQVMYRSAVREAGKASAKRGDLFRVAGSGDAEVLKVSESRGALKKGKKA